MMTFTRADKLAGAAILAMAALGGVALAQLPEGAMVPMHFTADGTVDRVGPAVPGLFIAPGLGVLFWLGRKLLHRVDPRAENIVRSQRALDGILLGMLAVTQLAVTAPALGLALDPGVLFPAGLGGLLVLVGNVMGKLRPSYTVGIRTPWTLADDRVWDKTHRVGGRVFVAGGLVLLLAALGGLSPGLWPKLLAVVLGVVVVVPVLLSWYLWHREAKA